MYQSRKDMNIKRKDMSIKGRGVCIRTQILIEELVYFFVQNGLSIQEKEKKKDPNEMINDTMNDIVDLL